MNPLEIFSRQVRSRSAENRRVMNVLYRMKAVGQMISVLRQELDSTIRVIYLIAQTDSRKYQLIESSVNGEIWRQQHSRYRVTDKEMVEISNTLEGYCGSVYKFGCAFIHLSNMHDYNDRDPFTIISQEDKEIILGYCRAYHSGPNGNNISFNDIIPYIPKVFYKVSENLQYYLQCLEQGDTLECIL